MFLTSWLEGSRASKLKSSMMGRYVCSSSFYYCFCFMFFIPLVLSQLPENQRTIMIKLSQLVQTKSWNTTGPNPCLWNGVTCTSTSITRLSLPGLRVSASDFLTVLCQIDSLQFLDLSSNYLGSIPDGFITDCGKISGLRVLNFSGNKLSGFLPTFHGFVGLETLDLSYNSLGGKIELQLDGLVGIKSLNLSQNRFNGFLPTNLGKGLEELQLSKNHLEGPIPEELITGHQNLTLIDLSVNSLTGSVPKTIGTLSKLKILLLSSNSLSGSIPESLSRIQTLSQLAANQNRFTGTIPSGISRYVMSLDLSYNQLNGMIPGDLLSPPNLQRVDLSYNSLEGSIPAEISPGLFRLRLGSNLFNGSIPAALGVLFKLTYLELDNNSLSGDIPIELSSCKSLALLNLAQNKLSGSVPKELGRLEQLQVMKLQLNQLNGEIPIELFQLSNLTTLNISGNSLSGSIPSAIVMLHKLVSMNLQDNKLTGQIPDLTGNLDLQELQLGANNLSGEVPKMPYNLRFALNLSHNCFEGPIPATLRGLPQLEILDLSNNKFTGKIPLFLTEMTSLTQLLLSNNQLSGDLPKFEHYVQVEISGNKDLKNTTTTRSPTYTSKSKRSSGYSATVVIIVSIVAAVLAIGIVGTILLLVSRRFYRVDDENLHGEEEISVPQVIQGHLITTNSINKSGIDFNAAMKAVTDPTNIILKSRFSTYYKAVMPCGTSYYVKKLNWSDKIFQLGSHDKFGQELEALGRLSNSNLMIPLAYVLTVDSAYLFYEYAEEGTLFDALHGSSAPSLDWANRFNVAIRVAEGLAYLHECTSGPVLLLELSTKCILLKSVKEPQIGDIELCKVIDPSKSTGSLSAVAGSVGYIPPEYAYTMRVTMPGNVYSFGVILLELVTGKPAVSEGTELAKRVSSNSTHREAWDHILDPSLSKKSVAVRNQMLLVLKVALGCIAASPVTRPKMKNVLRMLINAR